MENTTPQFELNAEYWENEIAYLENSLEGLKTAYGAIYSLLEHAKTKLDEFEN